MSEELQKFLWSIKNGDVEDVGNYVKRKGFDVNVKLSNGRSAMHYAADYGQTDVIAILIKAGADVNMVDEHGITPLLAAVWEDHCDTVQLLLEKGAKTDGKAPDGSSYIDCAESENIKQLLGSRSK